MRVNNIDPTDLNNPLVKRISDLKFNSGTSALLGNYREAIKAQKELAQIGVDNFELVAKVPGRLRGSIPLFSRMGLKAFGFMIVDKLRIKTPVEKKFRGMCKLYKKGLINF